MKSLKNMSGDSRQFTRRCSRHICGKHLFDVRSPLSAGSSSISRYFHGPQALIFKNFRLSQAKSSSIRFTTIQTILENLRMRFSTICINLQEAQPCMFKDSSVFSRDLDLDFQRLIFSSTLALFFRISSDSQET